MITYPRQNALGFRPVLTHLDAPETAVASKTTSLIEETADAPLAPLDTFRHSGWRNLRHSIYAAMVELRLSYGRRTAFCECGSDFWIMRSKVDPELFRIVPDHCHDRFCVPCGGQRQSIVRRNLHRLLKDQPHRFLTLTIRHDQESLAVLLDRLYRAFRLLRHRRLWRDRVRGGVAFLELTYDPVRSSWNPHLHCMLEGLYLHRPDLTTLWLACTGDSHNVKIKLINQKRVVVDYVTKYATKPLPASIVSESEPLLEAMASLIARRTIITFGSWKNWRLLDDPRDQGWAVYASLRCVKSYTTGDDLLCENILAMLLTADPSSGEFVVHVDRPEPDD